MGIWHFWMFTLFTHFYFFAHISYPFPPHLLFLHTFFTHSHHIYSFSRLIDMVIHFEGACYRISYFPPHFSGPFSPWICIGDRVFYTRSNGLRPLATVVGTAEDGLLHLERYQDGLRVVNRQYKMESISFAIPSSDSPPDCPPSLPPNTQSSSPPKAPGPSPCHKNRAGPPQGPLQSSLGRLILRVFPKGLPRGSSGGT